MIWEGERVSMYWELLKYYRKKMYVNMKFWKIIIYDF